MRSLARSGDRRALGPQAIAFELATRLGRGYSSAVDLGIDFGTTRTVVAYADRGNYPVVSFDDEAGDSFDWFPSVVAARGEELAFGWSAIAVEGDPAWTQARSFKRLLAGARADGEVDLGGERFGVAALVARFLEALHHALRTRSTLATELARPCAPRAVVATPANAFCTQRFVTLDAFRRAGFDVAAMLAEPSAAGFEYAHRHARTITSNREHVIVYDLGGGTFDASLVKMSGAHHDALTTSGIARLGGDDFDRALAELAGERAGLRVDALGDHARGRLLQHCRELKERLNPSSRKITVDLEAALGSAAPVAEIAIAVDDYYAAVAPLVERTIDAMAPVIDRLAGEVPRGPEDDPLGEVAGVYVVGGASALPLVGRMLRARFGRRVHRSPYPHAAIAIGLAIAAEGAAHGGSGYALSDRFSRNFGVFRESEGGAAATYDPIFTRETPLPAPGAKVSVARRYRAAHDVGHYRFFECSSFDDGGAPRGDIAPTTDVLFAFDPALRAGGVDLATWPVRRLAQRGPLVEERYEVDAHGIVELTITDLESGFAKTQTLGARVA